MPEIKVTADPVSAVANAAGDLFKLVTATIPSDELQRARFQARSPIIYATIRMRLYRKCLRHLRFRWHESIEDFVHLIAGNLTEQEQTYMITLLHSTLKR